LIIKKNRKLAFDRLRGTVEIVLSIVGLEKGSSTLKAILSGRC